VLWDEDSRVCAESLTRLKTHKNKIIFFIFLDFN
jgi:hypothetical protein